MTVLEGILPVWKPAGMTSHDVVARVRRITREKRIGHTGTLDPQVTGVLPLCIGHATRLVEHIQELPKTYVATLVFGIATDTEDMTGTIIERTDRVLIAQADLESMMERFQGDIEQVPPMYSAVKVDGKRLYELARKGEEVERKARTVTIYSLELLKTSLEQELPEASIQVECSKGTYIRTLCVDIGRALGCPSTMKALVRTKTGHWSQEQCLTLEQIDQLQQDGKLASKLIPMDEAVGHMPDVTLSEEQALHALQGKKLPLPTEASSSWEHGTIVRAYSPNRIFIGLFTWDTEENRLAPYKIFSTSFQRDAAALL